MEALLSRYRNLTVLLVVVVGQLLYLAYQVKTARDERLIRVWAVSAVTPMAGVVEAIRHNTIGFLAGLFHLAGRARPEPQAQGRITTSCGWRTCTSATSFRPPSTRAH